MYQSRLFPANRLFNATSRKPMMHRLLTQNLKNESMCIMFHSTSIIIRYSIYDLYLYPFLFAPCSNKYVIFEFYFTIACMSLRIEGLMTSQYEFWTDAISVLISILMKRRELNLGFEDWDDQSPSTQCQDQILRFQSKADLETTYS